MRTLPPLFVAGALLAGCSTTSHEAALAPAALDGPPTARAAVATDASFRVEPHALDPVAAEIVRAAFAGYERERRVALENIANVNTAGYKRRVVHVGCQRIEGSSGDAYTLPTVESLATIWTCGVLENTDRALDVAIDGEGFFRVVTPQGQTAYTRDGQLHIDRDGRLVDGRGNVVAPTITVPSDVLELTIDCDGRVSGRTAGAPDSTTMFGQLELSRFVSPGGLQNEGTYWFATERSGRPCIGTPGNSGIGMLRQGFVERSNVQMQQELLHLQTIERRRDSLRQVLAHYGMILP